ncbi:hypothetical protein DYB25_004941 [Aphanomyces astaci]|uniref:Mitochondrial import inner membrane translocase subunit TIM50 n=1 Tax=Aphanomyces astaci TaxID=112090 RepID=A0A397DVG6_APHAT|nr:hypothetical protein DYB25_004941 [Aphanomyces astaci]RHY63957.1 hypothetical protein DYB34_007457 [Aphanomyces astaci]RHY70924.1 hypothetical protein DYB30_010119 [Aphanomyces astaci]RHY81872.1 hypothetical protein DYB31_011572 [Aphanomyces astaci]
MNVEDEEEEKEEVKSADEGDSNRTTASDKQYTTADDDVDLFSPALKVDGRIKQNLHPHHPIPSTSTTAVAEHVPESLVPGEPDAETPATSASPKDDESIVEVDFNPFYFMKTLPRYSDLHELVRPVALPPKTSTAHKLCLVLDLDETLVHCTIDDIPQADLKFPVRFDLNVLGRDLAHVLLIDNSPHAFGYQVTNGVPIESWFTDESDSELLKLLPFLESLLHVDDVRPILAKQFQIQRLIDAAVLDDQ